MDNFNNSNNQGNQNYFGNDYFNQNNQQQINNQGQNNGGFNSTAPNQWGGQPTQNDWVNNQGQFGGNTPVQNNGGFSQYPNNAGYNNQPQNHNPYNQDYGTPLQQSNQKVKKPKKQKKQKRRSGCLVSLLKFFLIVILIIGIIIGAIAFMNHRKEQKEIDELASYVLIDTSSNKIDLKIEELKAENSDIEGMTIYDKIEKGLGSQEGSDSDGDGLTDKEEIEVYNSDPLKASTSGDGIPDSYKVKNNLNVSEKYDIDKVGYQGYNQFSNIEIKDKTAENSVVSITEIEGYKVQGLLADKVYSVINYNGKLTFDFSEYISSSDYMIFKKNDSVVSEYEVLKDKNGVVTVDTKGEDCVVGIVGINVKMNSSLDFDTSTSDLEVQVMTGNDSVIVMLPVTLLTGQMEVYVFEKNVFGLKKDRSAELTEYLMDISGYEEEGLSINVTHQYVNAAEYNIISKVLGFIASGDFITKLVETEGVEVSEEDESTFQAIMNFFIMVFNVSSDEWPTLFEESEKIKEDEKSPEVEKPQKAEKRSTYVSGFDVTKDALPFANVGTYISQGGNCAGFAMITSALFNGTPIEESDSMTFEGKTYSYDISDMDEFSTFFDIGLNDYKTKDYWKTEYGKNMSSLSRSSYTSKDAAFLDFLGYKWAEGNMTDYRVLTGNDEILWSEFETVKNYFKNNNKILNVGLNDINGGHAINAYGLQQDSDNPNIWYILVYDNNFPNHKFGEYSVNNWIKVVKKNPLFGESYIEYEYYPLPKQLPNYRWSSRFTVNADSGKEVLATVFQLHAFEMYDEHLNVLLGAELD